jgi:four helix bundle protein
MQHSLDILTLARPFVAAIARKDRDLATQLRRALNSVTLNLAEGFGASGGTGRVRFESARGSLYEASAGMRAGVAWGYIAARDVEPLLRSMDSLAGRISGLIRA